MSARHSRSSVDETPTPGWGPAASSAAMAGLAGKRPWRPRARAPGPGRGGSGAWGAAGPAPGTVRSARGEAAVPPNNGPERRIPRRAPRRIKGHRAQPDTAATARTEARRPGRAQRLALGIPQGGHSAASPRTAPSSPETRRARRGGHSRALRRDSRRPLGSWEGRSQGRRHRPGGRAADVRAPLEPLCREPPTPPSQPRPVAGPQPAARTPERTNYPRGHDAGASRRGRSPANPRPSSLPGPRGARGWREPPQPKNEWPARATRDTGPRRHPWPLRPPPAGHLRAWVQREPPPGTEAAKGGE